MTPPFSLHISADRTVATVKFRMPDGKVHTQIIGRPADNPWTAADIPALTRPPTRLPDPGQQRTARRVRLGGDWWLYTHVGTGPPTWWLPRVSVRHGLMVGWLRGVVAVSIRRERD